MAGRLGKFDGKSEIAGKADAGCIGLSTGLQYFPGSQSDTRELLELGKAVAKYDGIFTSHLRSYSNTLHLAIDEVIEVAQKNDIPAQISHIFWVPDSGRLGRPIPEASKPPSTARVWPLM